MTWKCRGRAPRSGGDPPQTTTRGDPEWPGLTGASPTTGTDHLWRSPIARCQGLPGQCQGEKQGRRPAGPRSGPELGPVHRRHHSDRGAPRLQAEAPSKPRSTDERPDVDSRGSSGRELARWRGSGCAGGRGTHGELPQAAGLDNLAAPFPAPPHRTVQAVLSHTAHRRPSLCSMRCAPLDGPRQAIDPDRSEPWQPVVGGPAPSSPAVAHHLQAGQPQRT